MKLTKRQLNQIIAESLGMPNISEIKGIPKFLNFKKMRKDLFALKKDIGNQELLDKCQAHMEDLKAKVDQGEGKFTQGRYQEALTLLSKFKEIMKAPTPKKVDDALKVVTKVVEELPADKPEPEKPKIKPDEWNPDPDGKDIWEYQLRNCVWYARKVKSPEKEFKMGRSKSTSKSTAKYLDAVKILDKAFPALIEDCGIPKKPKPEPKPETKPGPQTKPEKVTTINLKRDRPMLLNHISTLRTSVTELQKYAETKGQANDLDAALDKWRRSYAGEGDFLSKDAFNAARTNFKNNVLMPLSELRAMIKNDAAPDVRAKIGPAMTRVSQDAQIVLNDFASAADKLFIGRGIGGEKVEKIEESLSRGALYRRRYYGRY